MLDSVGRRPQPGKPVPFRGTVTSSPRLEVTTQILAGIALLAALNLGLLASLLAGLLVYEPRRVSRRPVGLGQAAKVCTSAWA